MNDNKNSLEQIAIDIVQRTGTSEISFRKLADEIGIKSSSVHYYYPEKSDLIHALMDRYSEEFFAELEAIQLSRGKLKTKLTKFIDLFSTVACNKKFCLCGTLAAEFGALDDNSQQRIRSFFVQIESWLETLLTQHTIEIEDSIDRKAMAKTIFSGLQGALLLDRTFMGKERIVHQKKLILSILNI